MIIIPKPQKIIINEKKLFLNPIKVNCMQNIYKYAKPFDQNGSTFLNFKLDKALSNEEYKILVDNDSINVYYSTTIGAYRSISTLKQIFAQAKNNEIPQLEIWDYPSITNRGYMLDVSRGKIPNISYLKKLVNILADLKYNQLQLYIHGFAFEYKNFPEYVKDTDPYSAKDILELQRYCKNHFITLVPNQNSFAHLESWTNKKEISHLAVSQDSGTPTGTLNPLLPESLQLIDKIYDGYVDLFETPLLNIGMDEPWPLGTYETKDACDKYGIGKVYTDYLKKVCNLASEKYNKIPMFWDDIVFKHEEEIPNIPKNAIVMEWGYETEQHFDRNCKKLKENGLSFYVCPGSSMWGSFTGRINNSILNISSAAECGAYYGCDGFLLTEWGDGGHPQFPATTIFPIVYSATMSWNCGNHNSEKACYERRKIIPQCKYYIDKYIYKITGEKSLADIVYRMGNYYLFEDQLNFNSTELSSARYKNIIPDEQIEGFKRVKKYMVNLRQELKKVKAPKYVLDQIKINCDMVIFYADLFIFKNEKSVKTVKEIITRFEKIWLKDNHKAGMEIFIDSLKTQIKKVLNIELSNN